MSQKRGMVPVLITATLLLSEGVALSQSEVPSINELRSEWPNWPYLFDELPEGWPLREEGPEDAAASGLYAGVARVSVAPPPRISQSSWGSAVHVETTGIDPVGMYATALVLSDGRQKFAMVDVDGGVRDEDRVIAMASARTGIPAMHIRLGSSHTHAGAGGVRDWAAALLDDALVEMYESMLAQHRAAVVEKVAAVIYDANMQLRPVHMYGGRGTGLINVNRRFRGGNHGPPAVGLNAEGFVDRELVVFRVDDAEGNPYAVLVNYQAHPTVLAYANTKVSPDYVGMVRKVVEEALPDVTALYFQGAAGNQGPIEGYSGDLSVAHRLGARLGHKAAAIALGIETVHRAPVFEGYMESTAFQAKQPWRVSGPRDQTLRFETRVIEVPGREIDPDAMRRLEAQVADARRSVETLGKSDLSAEAMQARAALRRFTNRRDRWQSFIDRTEPVTIQVQMLRIGELAIVAMPGEPFAEIGAAIKEASPFDYTMFAGYSSGVGGGYMPTAEEYEHGGYEVAGTRYGRGAADEVIRAATEMYDELE